MKKTQFMGSRLAKIPLHPRLAAIILEGQDQGLLEGILAACLISEEMIIQKVVTFDKAMCDISFQGNLLLKIIQGQKLDSIS